MNHEYLREILSYDPETGEFKWAVRRKGTRGLGSTAGVTLSNGYRQIMIDGNHYLEHRLAYMWMTGDFPSQDIDHINRDRADNRWFNLRVVNKSENMFNRRLDKRNKFGYTGVSWDASRGKWKANIQAYRKPEFLGFFDSVESASSAYQAAKLKLHIIREDGF